MRLRRVSGGLLAGVAVVAAVLATAPASDALRGKSVRMLDDCEPASFNAAVGPGTCVGDGETTFGDFIAELSATQQVEEWSFEPGSTEVHGDRVTFVQNRGGEFHTFTKVARFGGGFVPELNHLSGTPVPAPECATVVGDQLVPVPPSATNLFVGAGDASAFDPRSVGAGEHLFQCCVHPWMKSALTVRSD